MKRLTKIKAEFVREHVTAESKGSARQIYSKSRYGEVKGKKIQYMLKIVKMLSTDDRYQYRNRISVKFRLCACI